MCLLYIKYHKIEPIKNALKQFQPQQKNYNEERIESNSQMKEIKNNNEINNEIESKKNNNNLYLKKNNFIPNINENLNKFEKINIEKTVNSSFATYHTNKKNLKLI